MSALLGVAAVVLIPSAAIVALLALADAVQRRREAVIVRQIGVTDAIHREFGAIVAPTVRRVRGGWRVELPMDARRPETASVVELAARALDGVTEVAIVALAAVPTRRARRRSGRVAPAMSA